jgi:Flp pilus assembly pilin Flp
MNMPLTLDSTRRIAVRSFALLHALVREDDGQDMIEYAFLAAFIGVAGYVALGDIVPAVGSTYASWLNPSTGVPSLWEPAQPWTSSGS